MPNPTPFALSFGPSPITESLGTPPVNAETSQLLPWCGHPTSAVAHPEDERIRTRYCTMCAAEVRQADDGA